MPAVGRPLAVLVLLHGLSTLFFCFGNGNSFVIQQNEWTYKGHPIGYEEATRLVEGRPSASVRPILLLNGFGVGTFHQHRLMQRLLDGGHNGPRRVYGMDYLGQGRSWPVNCQDGFSPNEKGLIYSGDTWIDQIINFIEQVVLANSGHSKIHVVGNSVGGHLAVFLAAVRPDLIESLVLLNATPVWGLNLAGWDGQLPPPWGPKLIGRYLFDRIREYTTIRRFLENSYANRGAYDETLVRQIRECTEGAGGHAAFASILFSPPISTKSHLPDAEPRTFYECLGQLDCDVLIVFGKDDPWCKPAFAKKMLDALDLRHPAKVHRYVELSNVGHCPNHEAPQAVAKLLKTWTEATSPGMDQTHAKNRKTVSLVDGDQEIVTEQWGDIVVKERQSHEIPLNFMDRLATTLVG